MNGILRLLRNGSLTVASLFDELLPLRGDRVVSYHEGLVALDGAPQQRQLFADLYREIGTMSRFLVEEAGLRPGERVAIYKANDPYCFRWFIAVIRAGGVAVPLNPLLSAAEVHSIATHCEARIFITDRLHHGRLRRSGYSPPSPVRIQSDNTPPIDGTFLRINGAHAAAPPTAPAALHPDDTVAIFHTSGTSGVPRGAMLSSRALLGGAATAAILAPFVGGRELALFTLPWAHIMAVSTALYGLILGIPGLFLEQFEAGRAIELIERYRVTSFIGVPAMFARLLNSAPGHDRLASIRMWISASDHLPQWVRSGLLRHGAFCRLFGRRVIPPLLIDIYGMVELGGSAMMGISLPFLPGSGILYAPTPPFRVRVVDENGVEAPRGRSGECQVRGPGMTSGYWKNPGGTLALITGDGWLRTGDIAVKNRLGLIRLKGRLKDVIKCGGYSVYAPELEEVIASHPSVLRAAVIGVSHPVKGEVPVAVVELSSPSTEDELISWCRDRLAVYKVPRRIHLAAENELPAGVTEKLLKRKIRERYGEL